MLTHGHDTEFFIPICEEVKKIYRDHSHHPKISWYCIIIPIYVTQYNVSSRFGWSCSFCKQGAPHCSPQESDWSDVDWDGIQAKAGKETRQTNQLSDWDLPKPQSEPNSKLEVEKLDIGKLHLEQSSPKEEQMGSHQLTNITNYN